MRRSPFLRPRVATALDVVILYILKYFAGRQVPAAARRSSTFKSSLPGGEQPSMTNMLMSRMNAIRSSALDFKLGFRMLARYPGLTLVGTMAIAVGIALGALYFEVLDKWQNPRLPMPDADRVVSIHNWDAGAVNTEARSLHDFAIWREQLKTIDHLGASVTFVRNLATSDKRIEPVRGVEITASAFGLVGTPPLLGRSLTARDEQPGEPPVVVISYSLWKTRFDGDPTVVGRSVKLGTTTATIVGVMPERFGFPVNELIWAPLRVNGATLAPRTGPAVSIFGRLASGASIRDARAELGVIGARMTASDPKTHEHLSPRVTAYAKPIGGSEMQLVTKILYVVNGIFMLLLAVVCVNVATLVFARTATRGYELTVRTALGASRGRIISQLFVEALVLAALAAVVGLLVAKLSLRFGLGMLVGSDALPYWIDDGLSWRTVLYTALLTLFGAAIVGILPALRVTKINVHDALRSESAARSGLRFGGFWTAVIVAQVAITVALIPLAGGGVFESNRFNQRAEGIGAERYLTARVDMDREYYAMDSTAFATHARASADELERALRAEPGVERVAFADRLPVEDQFKYRIEVDSTSGGDPADGLRTSTLVHVSPTFFATFGTSLVAGRDFAPADFENGRVLIVNESFARYVFGGRNAIGRRIRLVSGEVESVAGKEWYEIVGMVKNFGWQLPEPQEQAAMYRPSLPLVGRAGQIALRVRDPEAFALRLRTIAADVDATIRLTDVQGLAKVGGGEAKINWTLTWVAWLVSFIVLLLSATGIHALMSFTVARRTREIGIRAALGASQRRIVTGIFSRAFLQISLGLLVGSGLAALMGLGSMRQVLLLVVADGLMLVVGLTACALPLRRALSIDPTEALRAEG